MSREHGLPNTLLRPRGGPARAGHQARTGAGPAPSPLPDQSQPVLRRLCSGDRALRVPVATSMQATGHTGLTRGQAANSPPRSTPWNSLCSALGWVGDPPLAVGAEHWPGLSSDLPMNELSLLPGRLLGDPEEGGRVPPTLVLQAAPGFLALRSARPASQEPRRASGLAPSGPPPGNAAAAPQRPPRQHQHQHSQARGASRSCGSLYSLCLS